MAYYFLIEHVLDWGLRILGTLAAVSVAVIHYRNMRRAEREEARRLAAVEAEVDDVLTEVTTSSTSADSAASYPSS